MASQACIAHTYDEQGFQVAQNAQGGQFFSVLAAVGTRYCITASWLAVGGAVSSVCPCPCTPNIVNNSHTRVNGTENVDDRMVNGTHQQFNTTPPSAQQDKKSHSRGHTDDLTILTPNHILSNAPSHNQHRLPLPRPFPPAPPPLPGPQRKQCMAPRSARPCQPCSSCCMLTPAQEDSWSTCR